MWNVLIYHLFQKLQKDLETNSAESDPCQTETLIEKVLQLEKELKIQKEVAALFQKERDHLKFHLKETQTPKRYFSI